MTSDTPHRGAGSERLAKAIARAGLASRRDAEAMILAGRVKVNGKRVGVATNVTAADKVTVDGVPLPAREAARMWLYHKPSGLVTTERDEKGRATVFDAVRERLGRVLSVGRLDLTSEGLLLLTNDGDLKRRLELPETGWLRRYRVRVNGHPDEAALDRLRDGIEIEGEQFAPMQIALDRTQGANAWLTIGLREGRNREIRRAMEAVGVVVTRLIRISYGPFQLGKLGSGEIEEIRPRILRDQLGSLFDGAFAEGKRAVPEPNSDPAKPGRAPGAQARPGKKPFAKRGLHADDTPRGPGRGAGKPGHKAEGKRSRPPASKPGTEDAKPERRPDTRRTNPSISLRGKPRAGPKGRRPDRGKGPKRPG